jgi:formylmethanofuran dehydrogenase subunit E
MNQQMQQVQIPKNILENADQHECECGCKVFVTETLIYKISAIASPVGKRTIIQQPRLICRDCGEALMVP